jgi:hypothetical protein
LHPRFFFPYPPPPAALARACVCARARVHALQYELAPGAEAFNLADLCTTLKCGVGLRGLMYADEVREEAGTRRESSLESILVAAFCESYTQSWPPDVTKWCASFHSSASFLGAAEQDPVVGENENSIVGENKTLLLGKASLYCWGKQDPVVGEY